MPTLLVSCGCGRAFSLESWLALPLHPLRSTDGFGGWLEHRHCPCGSTHSQPLPTTRTARIRTLMVDEGCTRAEAAAMVADALREERQAARAKRAKKPGAAPAFLGAALAAELAAAEADEERLAAAGKVFRAFGLSETEVKVRLKADTVAENVADARFALSQMAGAR
ncbi:MAG TPA: hypothetical protein VGI39_04995 [Polyangiaceae bacterium]|jgi:uncharacterized protein YoaH (UPF0181 family)